MRQLLQRTLAQLPDQNQDGGERKVAYYSFTHLTLQYEPLAFKDLNGLNNCPNDKREDYWKLCKVGN